MGTFGRIGQINALTTAEYSNISMSLELFVLSFTILSLMVRKSMIKIRNK